MKICNVCGIEKPLDEFYIRKDGGKERYRNDCKICRRERNQIRRHGFTNKDYEAILIQQQCKCKICGSILNSSRYTKLAIDHDHKTGKFRGLLCTNCNTGLGLFKYSKERLLSAITYLTNCEDIV